MFSFICQSWDSRRLRNTRVHETGASERIFVWVGDIWNLFSLFYLYVLVKNKIILVS